MSKVTKLVKDPKLFLVDMAKKRIPAYREFHEARWPSGSNNPYYIDNLPNWFNPSIKPELKKAISSGKPVYLYLPWIEGHTNTLMEKLSGSDDYIIAGLDIFNDIDSQSARRRISKYTYENAHIYRRMLASRLVPLLPNIKGFIFTFDWSPVMRVCANLCEDLGVTRILIPHESVFADRDKYYVDATTDANAPVADVILGWGELQKEIFTSRGYPAERFIAMGAPKFDIYKNYRPRLTREGFAKLFGLDAAKPIITYATQPLDSQFNEEEAHRIQEKAIRDVLDWCDANGAQLIIRTPPSKHRVLSDGFIRRIRDVANVGLDDATCFMTTPEEAIYHSALIVSINSTMLFEALLMGRPALSSKYMEFEQIWQNVGIPAATNRKELFAQLKSIFGKGWKQPSSGMEWAAQQLSNGSFDGKASARIAEYLKRHARNEVVIEPRKNPAERVMHDPVDNKIGLIGVHSTSEKAESTQLYLMELIGGYKRVQAEAGFNGREKLSGIDLFLQWGITPTAGKQRQEAFRKALNRPRLLVEDGFIRSVNIGLSGTPGLSVILDDKTSYYDATQPSRLETLLGSGEAITAEEKARARAAIDKIVKSRVSKYNHAPDNKLNVGREGRKKILLVDQRFGDQSIASGLVDENTFRAMLDDAIKNYPEHDILIKRHPDAIKGGKESYFSNTSVAEALKDGNVFLLDFDANPYSLFDIADEVIVATSGMGFEALMVGKKVHCYGMPFYAGWGVTEDRMTSPRRTHRRSIEEIFHFAYILLSRYYSPSLGRRCSVEELVDHIVAEKPRATA